MGPGCCSLTPVWLSPLLSIVCCAAPTIGRLAATATSAELCPRNLLLLSPSLLFSTLITTFFLSRVPAQLPPYSIHWAPQFYLTRGERWTLDFSHDDPGDR